MTRAELPLRVHAPAIAAAWAAAVLLACLVASAAGCASARRGETTAGPMVRDDASFARGEAVFMARCHKCHPNGEAGLGPGVNDKPLPDVLVRLQVREGLGAMPAFGEELIDEEELDDLVHYLDALHERTPRPAAVR